MIRETYGSVNKRRILFAFFFYREIVALQGIAARRRWAERWEKAGDTPEPPAMGLRPPAPPAEKLRALREVGQLWKS